MEICRICGCQEGYKDSNKVDDKDGIFQDLDAGEVWRHAQEILE